MCIRDSLQAIADLAEDQQYIRDALPQMGLCAFVAEPDVYKRQDLLIIPGAVHTDLYDQTNIIPFDKIQQFFQENLK